MQRLYVGGLSHTVTQKDLKDRFGKFGDVEDVELRTRRDDEGVPYKTFGYINIKISDADLKKCMTVLNKSKWKGGTLQIEPAKESFLHRLAEERQEVEEQRLKPQETADMRQKMLDSLSKAGIENFTMKAAVPGTEVPGHKDWVVSKFGRVLPTLQLRCQKGSKARTLKYDPSKYSHNIRKLDRTSEEQVTPVSQLTWELQGGDDDISKKRRGEFPPFEPSRPKKSRTDKVNSHALSKTRLKQPVESIDHTEGHSLTNGYDPPPNHRPTQRIQPHYLDSDVDSDEEIRRMVAAQNTSHGALRLEAEEDNLEVVGLDYFVKAGRSCQQQKDNPDDYDSADTDELLASRKPPAPQEKPTPPTENHPSGEKTRKKKMMKKKSKAAKKDEEDSSDAEDEIKSSQQGENLKKKIPKGPTKKITVLPELETHQSDSDSDDEEDDEEEVESAEGSDSDYEAMFSNVTHLEISLSELQRIAEENETTTPSILGSSSEKQADPKPAPKKGITPEDILASLLAEDSSEDERKKKKKKRKAVMSTPLPAFQGTGALTEEVKKQKLDSEASLDSKNTKTTSLQKSPESGEEEEEEEKVVMVKKKSGVSEVAQSKAAKNAEEAKSDASSSSADEDEEEEEEAMEVAAAEASHPSSSDEDEEDNMETLPAKAAPPPASSSDSSSSDSSSSDEEEEEKTKSAPPRVTLGAKEEEERQREANLRRLAAVQQRKKEAEEHKKMIQGALANLDAPAAGAGKHIVFSSDDEEEKSNDKEKQVITSSKKTLFDDSQSEDETAAETKIVKEKKSAPKLFDGSEDEEDDDEEDEDGRFEIKPQFEGRSGHKLMELQSRFGTDERFRMDSRFLEEDEEDKEEGEEKKKSTTEDDEGLEEERKKNLSILESVLGSSQQTSSSKAAGKAKTFRDVSALHYDPSKEEHAAFETKTEEIKESKAARRKKREEAQKLPEVSKEIYYDVSGDLKAVFGASKDEAAKEEEKTNWDQEEEDEEEEEVKSGPVASSLFSADPSAENQDSSGFKFSFFGDDAETEDKNTEEYKVESIQAPKVSWQQDPRFNDSSSEEEEEEEQEEDEEQSSVGVKTTEEETPTTERFFFFPDDSRLKEGPRLFCRSTPLEEQRDQWEDRRTALRQEYRKKHKDARRKLKSSQKT